MEIVSLTEAYYAQVNNIYLEGIATGNATFQTEGKSWDEWNRNHLLKPRLLAIENELVLGWAALSPVSARPVYAGVAEVSIYIAERARGKGVGAALMKELIIQSEAAGIWTLQAGIFPENRASITLHQKFGFRVVGYRERIGQTATGFWRDTILMERRSTKVGIPVL